MQPERFWWASQWYLPRIFTQTHWTRYRRRIQVVTRASELSAPTFDSEDSLSFLLIHYLMDFTVFKSMSGWMGRLVQNHTHVDACSSRSTAMQDTLKYTGLDEARDSCARREVPMWQLQFLIQRILYYGFTYYSCYCYFHCCLCSDSYHLLPSLGFYLFKSMSGWLGSLVRNHKQVDACSG